MRIYFVTNFIIYLTSSPGLLILLNEKSSVAAREIYPLIAGVGIGMLFHAPFAALTNGMSSQDLSKTTSAFFLVRFIGATSGLVSSHSPVRLIYLIPLFSSSQSLEPYSRADSQRRCQQICPLRFLHRRIYATLCK